MVPNSYKKSIFSELNCSLLDSCRTILQFKVGGLISFVLIFVSCGPGTTNNVFNENKYIQSNSGNGSGEKGGTGDGGGGQGVHCSEQVHDKRFKGRLLVRDIYEAITNYGLSMKQVKTSSENADNIAPEAFKVLADSVRHYFGPASKNLNFTNEQFWVDFEKRISFINDETALNYSQDANSPISLPAGCKIVQIAFWHESSGPAEDGVLYVDQKQWRKLDQFNKVALLAHEFFFKQARQSGYKNSDFVRNKIGQLLSIKGLDPLFKEWLSSRDSRVGEILPFSMEGFKYCTGTSQEDPTAKLLFYQYLGKDLKQHFVIPTLYSNSISLSFLNNHHFSFDASSNKDLARATDLMIFGKDLFTRFRRNNVDNNSREDIEVAYRGPEILTNMLELQNSYIPTLIDQKSPDAWSVTINSASKPIQISLLNPIVPVSTNTNGRNNLISGDVLLRRIYEKLLNHFQNESPYFHIVEEFNSAYIILNGEIDDAIRKRIMPDKYEKWQKLIKKLGATEELFLNVIPHLIHKIRLNLYTQSDLDHWIFFEDIVLSETISIFDRKEIILKNETASVKFQLECNLYMELYNAATRNTNSVINVDANKNSELLIDKNIDENFVKKALDKIRDLNSYGMRAVSSCGSLDEDLPNCNDIMMLQDDVINEKKIDVKSCSSFYAPLKNYENRMLPGSDREKGTDICVIMKFNDAKNSYIVEFNPYAINGESDTLRFSFIKRIPFDYEDAGSEIFELENPENLHTE